MGEGRGLPKPCLFCSGSSGAFHIPHGLSSISAPCSKAPCCYKTTQLQTRPVTLSFLQGWKLALTTGSFCRASQALAGSTNSQSLLPRAIQLEKQSHALNVAFEPLEQCFQPLPPSHCGPETMAIPTQPAPRTPQLCPSMCGWSAFFSPRSLPLIPFPFLGPT